MGGNEECTGHFWRQQQCRRQTVILWLLYFFCIYVYYVFCHLSHLFSVVFSIISHFNKRTELNYSVVSVLVRLFGITFLRTLQVVSCLVNLFLLSYVTWSYLWLTQRECRNFSFFVFLLMILHVQQNVLDHHVRLKTLLVTGTVLQRKNELCILVTCHIDYIKVCVHIDTNINMCFGFSSHCTECFVSVLCAVLGYSIAIYIFCWLMMYNVWYWGCL